MGNKIDGGQGGFERFADAAAGFFGMDESDTCAAQPAAKMAEAKVEKPASDLVDDIPDAPDGFLDALRGTVSKAGADIAATVSKAGSDIVDSASDAVGEVAQAAGESALATVADAQQAIASAKRDVDLMADVVTHVATKSAQRMIRDASDALNEVAEIPEELDAAGQELFVKAEEVRVELAQELDRAIENHPPDVVYEVGTQLLEGSWDLVGDIGKKIAQNGLQRVSDLADDAIKFHQSLENLNQKDGEDFAKDVIDAGARFVLENEEVLKESGRYIEETLGSEALDDWIPLFDLVSPSSISMNLCRTVGLKVANALQAAPGVAEYSLKNKDAIISSLKPSTPSEIATDIESLPIGARRSEHKGLNISLHIEVGGQVGGSLKTDVIRSGPDTYDVLIEAEFMGGAGAGADAANKGSKADLSATSKGKRVVRFEGPDAAEKAAKLMAKVSGDISNVLILPNDFDGGIVIESSGALMDVDIDIKGGPLDFKSGFASEIVSKQIDGTKNIGLRGTSSLSIGAQSDFVQVGDGLAQDWLENPKTGHRGVDALLGELPDGFVRDFKAVYGPYGGIKLKAEPEISAAIYTPAHKSGPIRAEFNLKVELAVGRSTLQNTQGIVIPDLGKLADALQMNVETLSTQLAQGELTAQDLMQGGASVASLVEFKGPKVVFEKAIVEGLNILGVEASRGNVYPFTIYERGKSIDSSAVFRQALDFEPGAVQADRGDEARKGAESEQLGEQAQNDLLLAHATSMRS